MRVINNQRWQNEKHYGKKTGGAKTQGFRFASHVCSVQRLLFHTFQPTWYVLLEQENSPDWRETQIMPNGVIHRL